MIGWRQCHRNRILGVRSKNRTSPSRAMMSGVVRAVFLIPLVLSKPQFPYLNHAPQKLPLIFGDFLSQTPWLNPRFIHPKSETSSDEKLRDRIDGNRKERSALLSCVHLDRPGRVQYFCKNVEKIVLPIIISFYFKIFTPDVSGLSRAGLLPSDVLGAGQPHVSPYIVGGDEVLRGNMFLHLCTRKSTLFSFHLI